MTLITASVLTNPRNVLYLSNQAHSCVLQDRLSLTSETFWGINSRMFIISLITDSHLLLEISLQRINKIGSNHQMTSGSKALPGFTSLRSLGALATSHLIIGG